MSGASRAPKLFSIPAGAPFLPALASALLNGALIPGFPDNGDPLTLSSATIFVPTRRAARALTDEIARRRGSGAAILPQILPLGALGDAEDASLFDPVSYADAAVSGPREAISELDRRLALTRLILQWGSAIRHAICYIDKEGGKVLDDSEAFAVLQAPGQAFYLARELAALIDEIVIEGVEWKALHAIVPGEFDRYWSITLDFLQIVAVAWPHYLEQKGLIDCAQRRIDLIRLEAALLQDRPPDGPMIVAGSTGTNAATAKLIAAIAQLPEGAVVLPGLDRHLDDAAWNNLAALPSGEDKQARTGFAAGHPQASLARLLNRLGASRNDVSDLVDIPHVRRARMAFISEALRPAETTEHWAHYRAAHGDGAIAAMLADIAYIDAENERIEAMAIAIAMREALEDPDRTAALITPDRNLARRVRSELRRWDIEADDSGGDSLLARPAGVLALLALEALKPSVTAVATVNLLNHADMRLGYDRETYRRHAAHTEIGMLRGVEFDLDAFANTIEAARGLASDPFAHPAKKAMDDADWAGVAGLLERLREALQPLAAASGKRLVNDWFALHADVFDRLIDRSPDEAGPAGEDYNVIAELFDTFIHADGAEIILDLDEYVALFESVAREAIVREPQRSHPRLKILGLLEARLLSADLNILAGLDEGVWPPPAQNDAFLNRPMRATLGLTPPERRIGQTAHDFEEAMGAKHIILTRSRKRGDAPAIPSRLIQRLEALAGDPWQDCRKRGDRFTSMATALDQPVRVRAVARPEPRPPIELRPQRLSVTEIETWRRDPYAIYAQKILRLQKLDAPGAKKTIADTGSALHDILAAFHMGATEGESIANACARIETIATEVFVDRLQDETFRAFNWPRIKETIARFVAWDFERRAGCDKLLVEQRGETDIALGGGAIFTLSARADRIELLNDGSLALVDYKSGRVPTIAEIEAGFSPQLTLEAVIAAAGGFSEISAGTPVTEALYLKLLGREDVEVQLVGATGGTHKPLASLIDEHRRGLIELANQFRDSRTPYIPRPYPQFEKKYNDYDHLARVKEWQADSDGGGE